MAKRRTKKSKRKPARARKSPTCKRGKSSRNGEKCSKRLITDYTAMERNKKIDTTKNLFFRLPRTGKLDRPKTIKINKIRNEQLKTEPQLYYCARMYHLGKSQKTL